MPRNSTNIQNLKILQVNLGRAKIARDIVQPTASATGIDIVIVSEPNEKISLENNYILDNKNNVFVIISNKNLEICEHTKGDEHVCLKWNS